MKNIVIIGNGVAGYTIANSIRKKNKDHDITIITQEGFPFYTRIYLPQYIVDQRPLEKIILKDSKWYFDNNIQLYFNTTVEKIDRESQTIHIQLNEKSPLENGLQREKLEENHIPYDKLVLATGSSPRFLPFGNPNVEGMFALRTIKDADNIKQYIQKNAVQDAFILGGGLLGIELGYHLKEVISNVTICEISTYLLPRQLDKGTSKILRTYLEKKGLSILLGKKAEKILGKTKVEGIKFEDGKIKKTQMIMQQMGIIPNTNLAKNAGLNVEKGIIVNEFLQTSDPNIYAAGDCVQFDGVIWGIIPACMEQAKIVANNILENNSMSYSGTFWSTRLKIAGINLSCYGISPKEMGADDTELTNVNPDDFLCRKVFISRNKLKGAILLGSGDDAYFRKNINQEVDLEEIQKKMNE
jgi:nitrite reductase (NADH) large subunit